MEFLSFARRLIVSRLDDDGIDRLNYYITPSMLLVFGLLLSAQQWVGQPIECWVPAQFNSAWEEYTENYCFVQNTYFVIMNHSIPESPGVRDEKQLSYYQWVPFILGLMAFFFHVPYALWNVLNWQSGLNVHAICEEAIEESNPVECEDQEARLGALSNFIGGTLVWRRSMGVEECPFGLPGTGFFVSTLNLAVKLLFVLNAVAQLLFLNLAFSTGREEGTKTWVFTDLLYGRNWETTGSFPRTTLCDFQVRVLGNLHRHTVQCMLLINMFNDKIFIFLWWWTIILIGLSAWNLVYWSWLLLSAPKRLEYVSSLLASADEETSPEDARTQRRFTLRHLRQDGVFVIRRVSSHAGCIIAAKLVRRLFADYKAQRLRRPLLPPDKSDTESSSVLPWKEDVYEDDALDLSFKEAVYETRGDLSRRMSTEKLKQMHKTRLF